MTEWAVEGDYMEACNCEATCPCIMVSPPTEGFCLVVNGWHVETGRHGDTPLGGLNVGMIARAPGHMNEGHWRAAFYLDERADALQREALLAIFSGAAGGPMAALGALIEDVMAVQPAPIRFERADRGARFEIAGIAAADITLITGHEGAPVAISGAPMTPTPGFPFIAARSDRFTIDAQGLRCSLSGKSAFQARFAYRP